MPVWTLPSNSDLNVVYDFTPLLGISTPNVSFRTVLENTDPQIGSTNNLRLNQYQGFSGNLFFNMPVRTNNATRGSVQINNPWFQSSTSTAFIGNTRQAFEAYSGSFDFSAVANYPYSFDYWIEGNTFTFYYSQSLSFSPYDAEMQDPGAFFTAYFS
jgi:hypothetical protein